MPFSTMQDDYPLTLRPILEHGRTVHAKSKIITFTGDGYTEATFAEVADRADQLAAALTRLGVQAGANYFSYYELVGQTDSAILVNDPAPDMNGVLAPPEPKEEMQLNYRIAYSDLVRINSGSGEEMQVTSVEFKGSFAEILYAAMEKGGAKYYSQYLDSHSQVIGFEYRDERLSCSRNTSYTWCEFNFIVDLK